MAPDRSITLPVVGVISLAGVLHAELEPYLTRQLGEFIRDPVVHARPLVRIAIVGAVAKPGFYGVPADVVLGDALMVAGGPTPDAKLADLRIERAGERLWEGDVLRKRQTGGLFVSEDAAADTERVAAGEVDPAGPLPGHSLFAARGEALAREQSVLVEAGIDVERRAVQLTSPRQAEMRRPAW